jgi:multidrug efflux system outer membrane protein
MQKFILTAIAAASLTACTMAPKYERPAAPVAGRFDGIAATGGQQIPAEAIGWRDFFADPYLQQLVASALQNNRDLRVAALNVEAAQAQYRIRRSDLFPAIDAQGSHASERVPSDLSNTGDSYISRSYQVGVGVTSYELDLFGRVRSLKRAALEQYFSTEATQRSAQISLVAEVANAYLTYLSDEELLRVTEETFKNQQSSYDLSKQRFDAGAASGLDLRQAQTALEQARANLAQYRRQSALDRNALLVLVGGPLPDGTPRVGAFSQQDFLSELPAGIPSEVLTRRPDVLAAEHQLIAANANIGAARAAFFPQITLTGFYGTASDQLSGLFDKGTSAWSFTPQIVLPIFNAGANLAGLDLAQVQKKIEIARYEKAIQIAFQEVDNGLASRETYDNQLQAQLQLLEATQETYKLAETRFESGVDDYLAVLDAQRSLYAAQQSFVAIKLGRLQNLVTLYKALGGGWNERTIASAQAQQDAVRSQLAVANARTAAAQTSTPSAVR